MEEQSCVLLENGRRVSAFASQLPFMRGTALTPDPGIKNRQAPHGGLPSYGAGGGTRTRTPYGNGT